MLDLFLPFARKPILPGAMPVCLCFPPPVAIFLGIMRTMPNSLLSAFGGDRLFTSWTCPFEIGAGLGSFIVYKRKNGVLHINARATVVRYSLRRWNIDCGRQTDKSPDAGF